MNGLCLELYKPDSESCRGLMAVYLYGFPGSSGKTEPVLRLVDAGYTVIQPHYRGTYDSIGEFSPITSISLLAEIESIIRSGELIEVKSNNIVRVPTNIDFVVGHSFGCFPALKGCGALIGVTKLLLLGPQIAFDVSESGVGSTEDGLEHFLYVERSRPLTYRLSDWSEGWKQLYDAKLDDMNSSVTSSLSSVMLVVGRNDKYFDVDLIARNGSDLVKKSLNGNYNVLINIVEHAGHGPSGLFDSVTLEYIEER